LFVSSPGDYDPSDFFRPTCGDEFALKDLNVSDTPRKKKSPVKKSRRPALAEEEEVVIEIEEEAGRSPKVQALLDAIEHEMEPDEKGVIFSQWTSFLDIIQDELESVGHTFTRIDSSMNAGARIDAMLKFDTESCDSMKTPRFVLCSLLACGTGINLTRGSCLFMMDVSATLYCFPKRFEFSHVVSSMFLVPAALLELRG
jgi:SNF2 family DNA or RNA helicase